MTSNSTIPLDAILNPYTPLAFLPPDVANPFQVICYGNVAILAVSFCKYQPTIDLIVHLQAFTWDWLMAIPEEYNIIRKAGFSWPKIIYFSSRFVFYDKICLFSCSPSPPTQIELEILVIVY